MAQVTSPIILDSTGQQIHSDLQQIKNVLTTPSAAEDITFDNTGTGMQADDVQDAITELKSNLNELTDITQWNHESVSIAPSSLDTWVDGTVSGLSDAKRCILTVYESSASNATKVGAYEFINVIGYGIITLIFTYNDDNTNNIYKSSSHVRVDFDNNKVGIRMVAKGTSATYRCIKDVYWI